MLTQASGIEVEKALEAVEQSAASAEEKIEMLVEIAMSKQIRPKNIAQLHEAIALYEKALQLSLQHDASDELLHARIRARRATTLQIIPEESCESLLEARSEMNSAINIIDQYGEPNEIAELHMNLGLIIQALSNFKKSKITDAISHYQKALRIFTRESFPTEFAILHNNLATAYLSIPMTDERALMREALAVQSFKAALEVVTIENDPNEYAMLQNNLGNALQYASSSHMLENNLRALDAYDEALKVRSKRNAPLSYANTISNKANCLSNLPDDSERPEAGNSKRLNEALALYEEAAAIFSEHGENEKQVLLEEQMLALRQEISELAARNN